jgi:hypothetical protein
MGKRVSGGRTDANGPMSPAQTDELRRLAFEAYEPDAFQEFLTAAEAERRIKTLRAKLKLLDGPPHPL